MPASVLSRETRSPYWKYRTNNTRQNTSRLTIPNGKFSFRILRAGSSSPRRREPPGKKGGTTFAFGAVLHVSRSPCGRCPARESSARLAPTSPAPGPALPEASLGCFQVQNATLAGCIWSKFISGEWPGCEGSALRRTAALRCRSSRASNACLKHANSYSKQPSARMSLFVL